MPRAINILGLTFGKLKVIRDGERVTEKSGRRNPTSVCLCECGKEITIRNMHLTSGHATSCGCVRYDKFRKHEKTLARNPEGGCSRLYRCWSGMIARCCNPKAPGYVNYGGRGIKVCDRWRESFDAFAEDMGAMPEHATIERKDNNGNYKKDNCRWATPLEQAQNRRNTVRVTVGGYSGSLLLVCRHLGITSRAAYKRILRRIKDGWSPEAAIAATSGTNDQNSGT